MGHKMLTQQNFSHGMLDLMYGFSVYFAFVNITPIVCTSTIQHDLTAFNNFCGENSKYTKFITS